MKNVCRQIDFQRRIGTIVHSDQCVMVEFRPFPAFALFGNLSVLEREQPHTLLDKVAGNLGGNAP